MISLLITILVIALIFALIWWVLSMIPLPPPFDMVVRVVLGIIAILILVHLLLPYTNGGLLR
jgi:hypothetical protein